MEYQDENLTRYFKFTTIIYLAIGVAMIMTSLLFIFLIESGTTPSNPELSGLLKIIVSVLGISGFMGGRFLYQNLAQKSKGETIPMTKLSNHRTASIIVWALLDGPGIFSSVAYFLTGDQIFLVIFALIFLGYLFSKPTMAKFQQDF
jgi:hypothetical protein